jgi:phosphatidate cytidylyltransferase
MQVGFLAYRVDDIPWFRHLSWYLLLASNYYYYGEYFFDYFAPPLKRIEALQLLISSHRFISYCLYLIGLISFVLSLVKKYNTRQFHLFAWAHVAILITVVQSYLVMRNTLDGETIRE